MAPSVPPPTFPAPTFAEGGLAADPPVLAPAFKVPCLAKKAGTIQARHLDRAGQHLPKATRQTYSRSTSSGSTTPLSEDDSYSMVTPAWVGWGPPQHEADAFIAVKNTFINVAIGRPASLDGFFEERQVSSCPVTRCPSLDRIAEDPSDDAEEEDHRLWRRPCSDLLAKAGAAAVAVVAPERCTDASEQDTQAQVVISTSASATVPQKQVLLLGDVLKQPELGSAELPTVGSANHRFGGCKPCAFAHTKGCENGVNCQFCHLCEPGEKKRRQKQRVARQPDLGQEVQPAVSPVVCRPMMSPVVSRPVMLPVSSNWQGSPTSNLRMAAVFRIF